MVDAQQVRQVKEQHKGSILRKPNVVGVGYGYKEVGGARSGPLCLVSLVRGEGARGAPPPCPPPTTTSGPTATTLSRATRSCSPERPMGGTRIQIHWPGWSALCPSSSPLHHPAAELPSAWG